MSITIPEFKIYDREDIESTLKNPLINEKVNIYNKNSYTIDVNQIMSELDTIGKLLSVANAGAQGFKCSGIIMDILLNFQILVNESLSTTDGFVETSISALKSYSMAMYFAKMNANESAFNVLSKSFEDAEKMEQLCGKLIKLSKSIAKQSREALVSAQNSKSEKLGEQRDIDEKKANLTIRNNELNMELKRYQEEFIKIQKEIKGAAFEAYIQDIITQLYRYLGTIISSIQSIPDDAITISSYQGIEMVTLSAERSKYLSEIELLVKEKEKKELILENLKRDPKDQGCLSLMQNMANLRKDIKNINKKIHDLKEEENEVLHKYIKEAKEKALQAKNKVGEFRKLQLLIEAQKVETSIQIKQSLHKIKELSSESNHLGTAIESLSLTIQNLGQITTAFNNTQLFWRKVKNECRKMMDKSKLELLCNNMVINGDNTMAINEIKDFGFKWLSFASVNQNAFLKIKEVKGNIDASVCNLSDRDSINKVHVESIIELYNNRILSGQSQCQFIKIQMENETKHNLILN